MTESVKGSSSDAQGCRGIVVAGLSGGAGKSVVSVAIVAALAGRGAKVVPFKKGPDYIDAGWLGLAAGRPCCNLDPYLMTREVMVGSFRSRICGADYVIVEGNRGLFDGVDLEGSFSTAELAITLHLPVLLVVDCTKATRTVAALVAGCRDFEPRLEIRGVVLNRVGTGRHEDIVRRAVEHYTGIPVIGALPRSAEDVFPQRHLGITPGPEHDRAGQALATLAARAEKYLDLARLPGIMAGLSCSPRKTVVSDRQKVRIGVIRDAAFQFYYQENLEALVAEGAELVEINALTATELPAVDGLYVGGGFPETSAGELAANESFLASLKERIERGVPVYAECGGLIYLGRDMEVGGQKYRLADIFPVSFSLKRKPQAHGYTTLLVTADNPFYPLGTRIKGHEFRYSRVEEWPGDPDMLALSMERGVGFADRRDGLVYKNVLAIYTHIHALGTPQWAAGMVGAARRYRAAQACG
ncbi:MAG: cobyrinate a,c-diamide synthase [Desulfurivibrionaceae bacterium]|nr:cobyrinate a,c-diamide synthase [Desulfobulbales bacterium]MDT8334793.1 cobyrinate a,c-diamide synthase [Desulfurivibrionaceae bacterium]